MHDQKYALKMPCAKCPFRVGQSYLRRERAQEISTCDGEFYCHATTIDDPDDDCERIEGPDTKVCAGWVAHQIHAGPGQVLRIAERLGLVREADYADAMDVVYPSTEELMDGHEERTVEFTGEACSVVGQDCEAPAGWWGGSGVTPNPDADAEFECYRCGEPVCGACSAEDTEGSRVCDSCRDDSEEK